MTAPHITGMEPWQGDGGPIRAKIDAEAGPFYTPLRTYDPASASLESMAREIAIHSGHDAAKAATFLGALGSRVGRLCK